VSPRRRVIPTLVAIAASAALLIGPRDAGALGARSAYATNASPTSTAPGASAVSATSVPDSSALTDTTSTITSTSYSETSSRIRYYGTWSFAYSSHYQGGRIKWSRQAGAKAVFAFSGVTVNWYGPTGSTRGKARVYLDGTYVKTVNMYSSSFVARKLLYSVSFPSNHTGHLKIVVAGTAGHPIVGIDSFTVKRIVSTSTAAPAGWTLVQSDDFNGTAVDTTKWSIYSGTGNAGYGLRAASALSVGSGLLTITAQMLNGSLVSGGITNRFSQAYGRFEFRVRTDPDPSLATSGVVLTWPQSGNWPVDGENDIYETTLDADRTPVRSFVHYGATNQQYWFMHTGLDGTQWHTMAMEWEPSAIRIYRDGVLDWTVTDASAIPDVAHHLSIQLDAFKQSMTGTVRLQVDWIRIYKRS
jgi:Glycosyl hydrolases family 16